jgi:CubicO group peptidase (beta-lactamase class C family)
VSPDSTLYDIASLTKVVGTTSAVMALLDDGRLALDAPVRRYVSAFPGAGKEAVTVRHLLEHRSGLAAGAPLWREGSPEAARPQALGAPLRSAPGRTVEYSDLGMIVLGAVVEAAGRWRCRWRSAPTATRTSGTPWRPPVPRRGPPLAGPSPGSPAPWRPRERRAETSASPLPQGCARTAGDGARACPRARHRLRSLRLRSVSAGRGGTVLAWGPLACPEVPPRIA